ncbi:hypothetical protein MKW94_024997 [Papaver nudicaule]|uniref:Endoglucanase n=1 Tax=Papaver nudicaule TaxID=74823 RepID=A0AA41RST0_PAPNU|nr:hypothetical protein [Papaver nudicaule]
MSSSNLWGGSFEMHDDDNRDRNAAVDDNLDRAALANQQQLHQAQQSWVLGPKENKRKKYIDFGCVVCSRKAVKWSFWAINWPKPKVHPPPPNQYSVALKKALLFFDAQMSGRLPENKRISWRRDSGLQDGNETDVKGGLNGGYYDAGNNMKFNFPMAFSMSMLSWSVIEYSHKYKAIGEYDHVRDIIRWGTDYLLRTFNSSATTIDKIYSQVGVGRNDSRTTDDHQCWERPEDMDYPRPVQITEKGSDLASEMAAALASASIVFIDNRTYSQQLIKGATALFAFGRDGEKRACYSKDNLDISQFYNSSGYFDEYMWASAWMYIATGNPSYFSLATNPGIPKNANAFFRSADIGVLSWDNKVPAAELLLTRMRIFLSPGYPYEDMLRSYHNLTDLNMCSYLEKYNVYNFTKGGLIQMNHGGWQNLQYAANAAFIASLYADYMKATGIPGWYCGPEFTGADVLYKFASSQVDYILGANPIHMSYVVGYGVHWPKHVHHRAASIPNNDHKYNCIDGLKWRNTPNSNPNNITGAMVGGPDRFDDFHDVRTDYRYTEPTLAGNAGLVAALVSLTTSGGSMIDKNTIFTRIPPLFLVDPSPPPPWKP